MGPSNEAAVAAIDSTDTWPQRTLGLVAPEGCGKTHLVEVWRTMTGAALIAARDLDDRAIEIAEAHGAIAVEDIDRGIGEERVLFHLFNLAREGKIRLLVTTRALPGELEIALPDLRSRLRAMAIARIDTPDEGLLRALLVKLLADRQQTVTPRVIEYVVRRMERSAGAAQQFVRMIDQLALAKRSDLTLGIAREVLDQLGRPGDEPE